MLSEELAATFEGHAASCTSQAMHHRTREQSTEGEARTHHHDLAIVNEGKAETLRWVAERIRTEFASLSSLLAQSDHHIQVKPQHWHVEHSIQCRLDERMADCPYTVWALERLSAEPTRPYGRFKMVIPSMGGMMLDRVN